MDPSGGWLLRENRGRVLRRKSDLPGALLVEASLPEGVGPFIPHVASPLEVLWSGAEEARGLSWS